MTISKDKVVSLTYQLSIAGGSGEIIETVNNNNPLVFILGHGNLLPLFEKNLTGLKIGDTFDFVLNSDDAYGKIAAEAIVDVPKQVFAVEGEPESELLTVGNIIPMMDQQGNRFNGKVISVETETVKMDFNHPLAGENLHFKGEVVGVRDATAEEAEHGHIHKQGGCGDGSCGDGSCGEGGCSTDSESGCGCQSGCGCN